MSTRNAVIAVVLGVRLVSSGLNTTNIDWPNLTMNCIGSPVLLSHKGYHVGSPVLLSHEMLESFTGKSQKIFEVRYLFKIAYIIALEW